MTASTLQRLAFLDVDKWSCELTVGDQLILKANVECCVGMGCKCHPCLANNILRPSILITHCIFYLGVQALAVVANSTIRGEADMHIDHLPISLLTINDGRHQHQCILGDKVPYTSFVLGAVPRVCC